MKRLNYIFIFLIAGVLLTSCCLVCENSDNPDSTITIKNNSSGKIVFFDQLNNSGDTSLALFPYPISPDNTESSIINSNEEHLFPGYYKGNLNAHPEKRVMIYIFSRDTIEKVPWERIRDKYIVLKRYDLTLDSLERRNWLVKYP